MDRPAARSLPQLSTMDQVLLLARRATAVARTKRMPRSAVLRPRAVDASAERPPPASAKSALMNAMREKHLRPASLSSGVPAPPHLVAADVQASMDRALDEREQHGLPGSDYLRSGMMCVAIRDLARRDQIDAARLLFDMELEAASAASGDGAAAAQLRLRSPLNRLVAEYGRSSNPLAGLELVEAVVADGGVDACDDSTFVTLLHALVRGRRRLQLAASTAAPADGSQLTSGVTVALQRVSDAMAAAGVTPSLRCRNSFLLLAVKGVEAAECATPQLSFDPDAVLRRVVAAQVDALWESGITPDAQTFATLIRGATQSRSREAVRRALDVSVPPTRRGGAPLPLSHARLLRSTARVRRSLN